MNSSLNNNTLNKDHTQNDYAAFIGIDWADQKHAFSLQEIGQAKKETGTLEQKPEVIGPWVAKLQERFGGRPFAVAVEQSRGAFDSCFAELRLHCHLSAPSHDGG